MTKYALMLAVAGLLVAAPSVVKAEDHAAHSETSAHVAATHELEDGTKVEVDGDAVFVVAADGSKTPAPDGVHKAKDGTTLTVKDGKLAH